MEIKSYDKKNSNLKINFLTNNFILGDNVFALNSLIDFFKDKSDQHKIKFVYIDPPYNTLNPELSYRDDLQHEEWLTFMQDRLERVKKILRPDGVICIQIDDREYARLYLLMAELFGEKNLKTIVVKMSESSGLKMKTAKLGGLPKLKEYLIVAKLDGVQGFHFEPIPKKNWDPEYNLFIKNFSFDESRKIKEIQEQDIIKEEDIKEVDIICKKLQLVTINSIFEELQIGQASKNQFFKENAWRICRTASSSSIFKLTEEKKTKLQKPQQIFSVLSKKGLLYLVKSDYTSDAKKPRVQILFAEDHLKVPLGDLWTDIKTTGLEFEGNIDFKNGKKPEKLMRRLIRGITEENDLVLDLFSGSGTTLSIALEENRRCLGFEVNKEIFKIAQNRIQKTLTELHEKGSDNKKVDYFRLADPVKTLKE